MVDAVADVYMKEMQRASNNPLEQSSEYRRIGEELVLDKLRGILEDVASQIP